MMETVKSLIMENNINSFQITDRVIAMTPTGSPRFDTAIWPGYNVNITMQIDDNDKASSLLRQLKNLNTSSGSNDDEMITACSWEMESFFYE